MGISAVRIGSMFGFGLIGLKNMEMNPVAFLEDIGMFLSVINKLWLVYLIKLVIHPE